MNEAIGFGLSRQQRAIWAGGEAARSALLELSVPLPEGLAEDALRQRVATSVAKHEILRTRVVVPQGFAEPLQIIDEPTTTPVSHAVESAAVAPSVSVDVLTDEAGVRHLRLRAGALIADIATLDQLARVAISGAGDVEDPVQYVEYAEWQGELGEAEAAEAHGFWSAPNEPAWSWLPDAVAAASGARTVRPLGSRQAVLRLIAETGASATAAVLGLWCCVIARLTGDAEVCLGVEVDARRSEELAGAAGPYTDVFPLTVSVGTDDSVGDVVRRCAEQWERCTAFQEWAPDVTRPAAPVLFGRGPANATIPRPGTQVEVRISADGEPVVIGTDGRDVLPIIEIAAAVVAAGAATAVAEIDVLHESTLSPSVAQGGPATPTGDSVVSVILANARRKPDRVALRRGDQQLTYAELVTAMSGVLAQLAEVEEATDGRAPIAVLADRTLGAVVALLAALAAGRAYVPLHPGQPGARLAAQLRDSGADILLADQVSDLGGLADVDPSLLTTVRIDLRRSSTADLPTPPAGATLAYLIYTSGSTGTPKGVEVTHANLAAYVGAIGAVLRPEEDVHWALATPPSTDLGNTTLFGALVFGGTLVVLDDDEVLDPSAFSDAMRRYEIDIAKLTPSHLASLLAGVAAPVLPRQVVMLGGEALPWTLVESIRAVSPCRIINHYGPTETTVGSLTHEVAVDEARDGVSVPIGRPLAGTRVAALTGRLAAVPIGAVGELFIGGAGVARGYRHDEERTRAQFVADPARPGERLYRTGDLVRWRADGEVQFVGRRDSQVKIRGFRVETGEVEAALLEHPGVQRAAVVLRSADGGLATLAAYVVSHFHPSPTAEDLRQHLNHRVPAYMVPSTFTEIDQLPLTANGKLNVKALPEPSTAAEAGHAYSAPRGTIESEVAAIYSELLRHDPVGRDDDFFRLGGHSLLATQVVMRVRQSLVVDLPIQAIFVAPTVAGLAGEIEALVIAETGGAEVADLLAQLNDLTDEQAAALLDENRVDDTR